MKYVLIVVLRYFLLYLLVECKVVVLVENFGIECR